MFFRTMIIFLLYVCADSSMTNITHKIAKDCLVQQKKNPPPFFSLLSADLMSWIGSWVVEQITMPVKRSLDHGGEVREGRRGSRGEQNLESSFQLCQTVKCAQRSHLFARLQIQMRCLKIRKLLCLVLFPCFPGAQSCWMCKRTC